uniref:Leucine-rich repeat-containing N-terminal plant-type domain-containing protein n=1 Tax=Opuntia streptacantha TaxID=393608 RepID=A0A7C8ZGI3_OPUST
MAMEAGAGAGAVLVVLCLLCCARIQLVSSFTQPDDDAALLSLRSQWRNTPPSWRKSDDPCGGPWEGVMCSSSRVVALTLSSMGLKGLLPGDIGDLSELISLDLSFNRDLTGPVSARLGDLKKLNTLILAGCGFSGNIPPELGNLAELNFLYERKKPVSILTYL